MFFRAPKMGAGMSLEKKTSLCLIMMRSKIRIVFTIRISKKGFAPHTMRISDGYCEHDIS